MKFLKLALYFTTIAAVLYAVFTFSTKIELTMQHDTSSDERMKNNHEDEKQILHAVDGAKAIKQSIKTPSSFKLESMNIMQSGAVCYVYLSDNQFGVVSRAYAVLLNDEVKTSGMEGFDLRWKDECQAGGGRNITGFGELMVY